MESKGFPFASFFLVGAIAFEVIGGLMLVLGFKIRVAAAILILFLLPTTLIFHVPGIGEQREMIATLKNLAILGALIKFYFDGAGPYSMDGREEST